jgi:hypothetical protein
MGARNGPSWIREQAESPAHFVLTGGQTHPSHELKVETLLTAQQPKRLLGPQSPEAMRAMALCRGQPSSVAELAALLSLPVQITKVLLARLIDVGVLAKATTPVRTPDDHISLLEAVRDGLLRL